MAERIWRDHSKYFEAYAGVHGLKVEPSPPKLGTFAVDLEKGVVYVVVEWFLERGYSEAEIPAHMLHELEHVREADALVHSCGGVETWRAHGKRRKESRRYGILDNWVDDIKVNRTEMLRAPVQTETLFRFYRTRFNKGSADFTDAPRHLQFAYSLLRRGMLPDESIGVAPEVRAALDELDAVRGPSGRTAMDIMTDPQTEMSTRLALQERYVEPLYERLFQQDVVERAQSKDQQEQQPQQGGEGAFSEEYDAFDAENPDGAFPDDALGKAVEDAEKAGALSQPRGGQPSDAAAEARVAYAREHGVSEGDLTQYRRFYEQIAALSDPETDRSVVDELRGLFERIISERQRPRMVPKHPVTHGHRLSRPAQAHIATRTGDRHPPVWETIERKEKKGELYGDIDVALVCDRSESMAEGNGQKAVQQRLAAGLALEALTDFADLVHERKKELADDLTVRTQVWSFGDEAVTQELKPLNDELTEQDRVSVYRALGSTSGQSTMDYAALERIADAIGADEEKLMRERKLKKIIIVLTDGDSSNTTALKSQIARLREMGAVVVGVGITKEGTAAKKAYAPDGLVCEDVVDLPRTLAELLKKHLADVNIRH